MNDDNRNRDKLLREKLKGYSVPPPPHVWDNVQGQMLVQKKQKRRMYFGWIAAAAVVVLAFIAGWYINNDSQMESPIASEQQIIQDEIQDDENRISEEKIFNAELKVKEELKSDNSEEILKVENIQKNKPVLLASKNKQQNMNAEENFFSNSARVKLDRIPGKNVEFENYAFEVRLAEKQAPVRKYNLSNSDDLIVASNARNFEMHSKKETGWKMGMHISPAYSSHVTAHSDSYSQNMNYTSESGNGNIGGGLSVQYKTSKKLRVESGVYYAQSGQKSSSSPQLFSRQNDHYDAAFAPGDNLQSIAPAFGYSNNVKISNGNLQMNSSAGIIEMNSTPKGVIINSSPEILSSENANTLITDGAFSQVFDFIEIPLYLRYNLLDKKFGIELMGGLNAGVVVGNNAYIDNNYGLQNIGTTQDISTINLSGTIGVGANYNIGKHISVAVEPRLNYYLNSINTSKDVVYRPYRIGFYTGLYYEF